MDYRKALWDMVEDLEESKRETWRDQYLLGHESDWYYAGKRMAYAEAIDYIKELLWTDASSTDEGEV